MTVINKLKFSPSKLNHATGLDYKNISLMKTRVFS